MPVAIAIAVVFTVGGVAGVRAQGVAPSDGGAPSWAYGYMKPHAPGEAAPPCPPTTRPFDCAYPGAPVPDDGIKRQLPGSTGSFTRTEAYFDYGPADWYPGDHPAMPEIVAKGRQKDGVRACALCHYPNGQGKMENGGIAGLPAPYILQQLADFTSGARRSADPRKANTNEMAAIAAALTDAEAKAAAGYFASMPWRPWVRVVEASEAPRVRATTNGLFLPVADAPMDPVGTRIIEMPEQPERTEMVRDPRAGFVAYVPVGSIAKGEALATTGGGRTTACAACHGPDLNGVGVVPGIAGRSPSYTMRQLYDMQRGARRTRLMAAVVEKISVEDMVNLAAYVASQPVATRLATTAPPAVQPAAAQTAVAGRAYAPLRTADGHPDLQGLWQVLNTAAWDIQDHNARLGVPAGRGVVEGNDIPYQPWALAKKQENFAKRATLDPETKCFLPGVPRVTYMPYPFQIVQVREKVSILYEYNHALRHIYMNGNPHPKGPIEWWMGDSRGTWDGHTLVVDTLHFTAETWLDRAGNFHSEELHLVERFTPTGPDHIRYEVTLEDPKVFTRPWKMSMMLYRIKEPQAELLEYECHAYLLEETWPK